MLTPVFEQMRLDNVVHKSTVMSARADERSIASDDSTKLIIKRTVDITYSDRP